MDLENTDEIIASGDEDELNELRLFLFKESCRLENMSSRLDEEWERLEREKREVTAQRKTLQQERSRFEHDASLFEAKMKILTEGFAKLDADRQQLKAQEKRLDTERRMLLEDMTDIRYRQLESRAEIMGVLFKGADNELLLKKRYRELVKIFHPDNCRGDDELVQLLNIEYSRLCREIEPEENSAR